jgi:LSD1 subclass zinc finger protein
LSAAVAAAFALASAILASDPARADGDAPRGKAKIEQCVACHGETGNSTMENTPSLAGQPSTFLFLQLFLIRDGLRPLPLMQPFLEGRSDQDLEDMAAFFAAQTPEPEDTPRHAALYTRGAELSPRLRCASCHAAGYVGQAQMPRLAGQREDYMVHAMRQYQTNERAASDTTMTAVLYGLSADDIAALAHYMAQHR